MQNYPKANLYEFHKMFEEDILITYKGPFDEHILSVIGKYIDSTIGANPKASKKIFYVFMELAQNISYYSAEVNRFKSTGRKAGVGTLVIAEHDDYYYFSTGNMVRNEDIGPIIDKCEHINTLDREALRQFKREQRNLPPGERGNAHIGLIQVALTSANPLDFKVTHVDDGKSYFAITIKIDK